MLSRFGTKYGIGYPLLSDEGSQVIRRLGILNEDAPEQIAGIPHPGAFVLNADGTIRSKHFYPSYRERDTGEGVLEHLLGLTPETRGVVHEEAVEAVRASAWLSSEAYAFGQRIWLTVDLDITPGFHVYGRPIPDGYQTLEVMVAPIERVVVGEAEFPAATPFRVTGLDEQFYVYDGHMRVALPISFMGVDAGELAMRVTVSFQACSAMECLAPRSLEFLLPIAEKPLIERPQAAPPAAPPQ